MCYEGESTSRGLEFTLRGSEFTIETPNWSGSRLSDYEQWDAELNVIANRSCCWTESPTNPFFGCIGVGVIYTAEKMRVLFLASIPEVKPIQTLFEKEETKNEEKAKEEEKMKQLKKKENKKKKEEKSTKEANNKKEAGKKKQSVKEGTEMNGKHVSPIVSHCIEITTQLWYVCTFKVNVSYSIFMKVIYITIGVKCHRR